MRGLVLMLLLACRPPTVTEPLASLHEEVETPTPESPRRVLLGATASGDVEVRSLAMTWLIRDAGVDTLATFAAIGLSDSSPYVRTRAIQALGERLPEPIALAALSHAIGENEADPWVVSETAHQLRDHVSPAIVGAVAQQFHNARPRSSGYAPLALAASLHRIEGAGEGLCTSLSRGEVAYDIAWLKRLIDVDVPCLGSALKAAQDRVEPEILHTLQWVRHQRGELRGHDLTLTILKEDEASQLEFLDLVTLGDLATAQPVLRAMANQPLQTVHNYASLLLAEVELDRRYARELQTLASSADPLTRAIAVDSAGRCVSRASSSKIYLDCAQVITRGLEDAQALVRREAAETIPSLDPVPDAIEGLRVDPFSWNRVQAAGILIRQNPEAGENPSENGPD